MRGCSENGIQSGNVGAKRVKFNLPENDGTEILAFDSASHLSETSMARGEQAWVLRERGTA
jgi:hypothetical protein